MTGNTMGWRVGLAAALLSVGVPWGAGSREVGLVDGLWVMQRVDERYEGDDVQEDLRLTLTQVRNGAAISQPKIYDVRWLKKDYAAEEKLVIHFLEPEISKGITLLMEIKPFIDDDRWLYLPKPNMIKKVSAMDQYSSFMGTDFSYYDLSEREPAEEDHKVLRIETLDGVKCYVVETTPKVIEPNCYSKKISWVDTQKFIKRRIQYYDMGGKFKKQYDPSGWQQIQNIWTATTLVMEDSIIGHRTVIERTNIRYNQGLSDDLFRPRHVDCVVYRDGRFSLIPFEQRPTRVWADKKKAGG